MIRVAITSDTHADISRGWDEHCRVMGWIADDMQRRKPDLVLHLGDIFDGQSNPTERDFVAQWCQQIATFATLGVVAGNHDRPLDIVALRRLGSRLGIVAVEDPGVYRIGGVAVAMLPYPRTANLLAALGPVPHEQVNQVAVAALKEILLGFRTDLNCHNGPRVLALHGTIEGSKTDSRQPLCGSDMIMSCADMVLSGAQFVVAGHTHAENAFEFDGVPVVVPGCPMHRTYGEPGPTSYVIADFDSGRLTEWERIPVPARSMLLLTARWDGHALVDIPDVDVKGADVRLRYDVDTDQREAAKRAVEEWSDLAKARGVATVKPEAVVATTLRARAPEIATAKTLAGKLQAYWAAKGIVLGPRESRVMAKVAELGEVR